MYYLCKLTSLRGKEKRCNLFETMTQGKLYALHYNMINNKDIKVLTGMRDE